MTDKPEHSRFPFLPVIGVAGVAIIAILMNGALPGFGIAFAILLAVLVGIRYAHNWLLAMASQQTVRRIATNPTGFAQPVLADEGLTPFSELLHLAVELHEQLADAGSDAMPEVGWDQFREVHAESLGPLTADQLRDLRTAIGLSGDDSHAT